MVQLPLEISYRNVRKTKALESLIREKVDKLEQVCNYMTSCRITMEKPQQHQRAGNPYRIRLDIKVPPGHKIVVRRQPGDSGLHQELTTVVREAFQAARRQILELVERQRQEVKTHPHQMPTAVVSRLFRDEGYGFIKRMDGREIYFHENSVLRDDFDRLEIGTGVSFTEEMGEKSPQASSVQIVDKPGRSGSQTTEKS